MGSRLTKLCSKCKEVKPISEFKKKKGYKNGIYCWCKACSREDDRLRKLNMSPENKKAYGRRNKLKNSYGITLDQYNKMLKEQNHKCSICGKDEVDTPKQRLHVDHCHTTGKVRGLLCHYCNIALGHLFDSKENLMNAIKYLENSNGF